MVDLCNSQSKRRMECLFWKRKRKRRDSVDLNVDRERIQLERWNTQTPHLSNQGILISASNVEMLPLVTVLNKLHPRSATRQQQQPQSSDLCSPDITPLCQAKNWTRLKSWSCLILVCIRFAGVFAVNHCFPVSCPFWAIRTLSFKQSFSCASCALPLVHNGKDRQERVATNLYPRRVDVWIPVCLPGKLCSSTLGWRTLESFWGGELPLMWILSFST